MANPNINNSPITQVSQTPVQTNLQPQLLTRLLLDLRGKRFSVDRETIMNLPESVLLCLFPNGLVLSRQSAALSDGGGDDDYEELYGVDFDPDCFSYVLAFFRKASDAFYGTPSSPGLFAAQQHLADGGSPTSDYGPTPSQNPLLSKQAIIVLREELEYFSIPPKDGQATTNSNGIANDELLDLKRKCGNYLLHKRNIFTALAQRVANDTKKGTLKERKLRLAEMYSNIRTLAPLVEQDYTKAKALSDETVDLARKVLDARLKLTRLRQAYPQPRLTVPSAEAQLDAQVLEMQTLEDELQHMNENVEAVKDRVKASARDVERLRIEKGEAEKLVKMSKSEEEDGKVIGLYHWYTFATKLHSSMHQLESFTSPSENELRLVYVLKGRNATSSQRVSITFLFVPNTHQLAEAQVTGLPSNDPLADIIGAHIQANNVPGLIAAVLQRAREEISGVA